MKRGLERTLDECLSQLNTGELGLEEVLARHPEHEAELRPLLRVAMLVRQTPRAVPSRAARAAGRQQLLAAVVKKKREKAQSQSQARPGLARRLRQKAAALVQPWARPPLFNNMGRQPLRLAQAIAAALVIVSLVSAGTVGVAADSLPGSPLYPIKRTAERVQLALTTTPASKARLHMSYAERRLDETRTLWEAGKGLSEATLQAMKIENSGAQTAISRVSEEERPNLLTDFALLTKEQQETLEEMRLEAPPSDQEAVEAAEDQRRVATEDMAEPDLLLTPSPMPTPTDTAAPVAPGLPAAPLPTDTPVPPTFTWTPVPPTATPVPPTFTPIPVPTATPVPPTATPIPTPTVEPAATPTPQAGLPTIRPTVEPTATLTPQAGLPTFQPTVDPTVEPTPTATATPTPTPTATATPTAQAAAPFQP